MKLKQRAEAAEHRQNPPQPRQHRHRRDSSRQSIEEISISSVLPDSNSFLCPNPKQTRDIDPTKTRISPELANEASAITHLDQSTVPSSQLLMLGPGESTTTHRRSSSRASSLLRPENPLSWSLPPPSQTPNATRNFEEPNPDDYYGDSSTLSFMQAVQTTIISNSSPDSVSPDSGYRPRTKPRPNKAVSFRLGVENCLPQRSLADDLVNSYFRYVHILYPFLHRPTFEAQYESTWVSGEQQDDQWLAMLNVIFALGIHFAYGMEDKSTASDRFFGYAQKLVSMEQFAHANLQTLQLLLLSGLYYQSTSRPNQTWNVIGLAIRIATTIGAHVDPTPAQYNPVQIEVRRRCWYGCIVLDS